MAVLKCTVCGGELDVNEDLSVGVCKFCDSVITIPKELDRKGNLYNRAIFLRQNNEFDKALATYEDILKEDNCDAEAHWGLVLSKYGIEYVLDPTTQERIPTCHRTQTQSILSDPDYLAALEHSDIEAQRVIENEAKRINKIQTRTLEISQKEEPYDIFICYKETDELGNRTEDSTIAQELYYELKKKGYRVFFARKTLESKLGTEYEPIIFAALNSAKVMIVLGTKAEHFNAVWVKNEWSRFIHMSKDAHKTIIPAYRGILPYELPAELSALQSQDMSKIGFMQDLIDGIERCIHIKSENKPEKNITTQAYGVAPLERLLQNGATYLKLSNYSAAEEVYTTVTKEYPEDHKGWWGLIVCKTKNFSKILSDLKELNILFKYVEQLANPKDFEELKRIYIDYAKQVSLQVAREDIDTVQEKILKYQNEIQNQNNLLLKSKDSKTSTYNDYQIRTKNAESILCQKKDNFEHKQHKSKFYKILSIISVLLFITAIFIVIYGFVTGGFGGGLAVSIVFGVPTFFFARFALGGQIDAEKILNKAQLELDESNKELLNIKSTFQDVNSLSEKEISHYEQAIVAIQNRIEDCQRYINVGQEQISTLWFHKLCSDFGVEQPFDEEILKYQKAAFGSKNIQNEISMVEEKDSLEKNDITSMEEQLRQAIYHGDQQSINHLLNENNDSYLNFVYKIYLRQCISNRQKEPYDMLLKWGIEKSVNQDQCDLDCNYAKKYYLNPEDSDILPHAFQYLVDDFLRLHNIDLSHDKMAEQRIREALFQSYQELKKGAVVTLNLPFITADASGPKHLEISFSRYNFN